MTPDSQAGSSVLIVDPDPAIRGVVEMVLKHSGFPAVCADGLDMAAGLLDKSSFAVILRDLNLTPSVSRRTLQQLSETAPELLRRTVLMTTAPARAAAAIRAGTVFAIVCKPFDIEELVRAVRACARGSREPGRDDMDGKPPAPPSRRSAPDRGASLKIDSVQRFVKSVASLQHLLSVPVSSRSEAALRADMRRILEALSATWTEAAGAEASRTRAAVFRAASTAAERLSTGPSPATAAAASRRGH